MKFDHFSLCKYLPAPQRDLFNKLKIQKDSQSRGKSGNNTSKYYYDSAIEMGMRETFDGAVILENNNNRSDVPTAKRSLSRSDDECTTNSKSLSFMRQRTVSNLSIASIFTSGQDQNNATNFKTTSDSARPVSYSAINQTLPPISGQTNGTLANGTPIFTDRRLLATPSDEHFLNPVHCFVRKNVEVFIANAKDVAAPAPGRKKPIILGQVGIRCIHCKNLPPKYRVKRAICYPPTIASLYHAVSNMKFDHYGACKGLTPQERQSFSDLKAASSRKQVLGRSTNENRNYAAASLARYYQQSARSELGLYDTENGIRVVNNSFLLQDDATTRSTRTNTTWGISLSSNNSTPPSFATMDNSPRSLSLVGTTTTTGGLVSSQVESDIAFATTRTPMSSPNGSNHPIMDGMSALMLAASDSRFGRR
jgi:hypothetical protein